MTDRRQPKEDRTTYSETVVSVFTTPGGTGKEERGRDVFWIRTKMEDSWRGRWTKGDRGDDRGSADDVFTSNGAGGGNPRGCDRFTENEKRYVGTRGKRTLFPRRHDDTSTLLNQFRTLWSLHPFGAPVSTSRPQGVGSKRTV